MALIQPQSVLKSMAPDTTEGREDKAAQSLLCTLTGSNTMGNWSHPSLAKALRREGPAPHLGTVGELTL